MVLHYQQLEHLPLERQARVLHHQGLQQLGHQELPHQWIKGKIWRCGSDAIIPFVSPTEDSHDVIPHYVLNVHYVGGNAHSPVLPFLLPIIWFHDKTLGTFLGILWHVKWHRVVFIE